MKATDNRQDSHSVTSERLAFLDNLRAIAIIMVVAVHTLAYCFELPQDHRKIIRFIVQIAVPIFFLVDGYLFARSAMYLKSYSYPKYVSSSFFRLVVPWVVFTLTYTLTRYAFELIGFFEKNIILGHSWQEILTSAYGSVYANHMYFLLSLFLIRLCSPIFKRLFFNRNYLVVLLLFFCYSAAYRSIMPSAFSYLEIPGGEEPVLHALWGSQFYLVGMVLFITSEIFDLNKLFMPILLLLILVLLTQRKFPSGGLKYLVHYLYLLATFLFFAFLQREVPAFKWIGRNTMGIYLIHAPIVLKGVSLVLNTLVSHPMVSFVSVFLGTLVLSVLIVMIINYMPYGPFFFGKPYRETIIWAANKRLNQA